MDVFITGGTGLIGLPVVKALAGAGYQVIGLARSKSSSEVLRGAGASAYPGDLRDPDSWVERASACDAVVHAGATFSGDMGRVDRHAMLALKNAARHRKHPLTIIYTGGIWLFPPAAESTPITEKTPFSPLPAFHYMSETIRTLSNGTGLNLTVIHPALVCSRTDGPIFEMTQALKDQRPFVTRAKPETLWPLVEVNDLAKLYLKAVQMNRFRMALIASGIAGISTAHLAAHISARHGASLEIETEAAPADVTPSQDWAAGYALSQTADSSNARRQTGWAPDHSTVEDMVVNLSK